MRLTGKREIVAYLGRKVGSIAAWLTIRERYASVIRRDGCSVWTTSEELDELDRSRHPRLTEDGTDLALAARRRKRRLQALGIQS